MLRMERNIIEPIASSTNRYRRHPINYAWFLVTTSPACYLQRRLVPFAFVPWHVFIGNPPKTCKSCTCPLKIWPITNVLFITTPFPKADIFASYGQPQAAPESLNLGHCQGLSAGMNQAIQIIVSTFHE
jgi:hypothetical protein